MEHTSIQAFEVAEGGRSSDAHHPVDCPVLSEFAEQASAVVPHAEEIAQTSTGQSTLARAWARLAILLDYVVRICLPEIFRECGRLDSAKYLANLPEFGLGSQVGLYYCALKRCVKGAANRYLDPLLSKIGEMATLLRRDLICKDIPAGFVANLWHFIEIRGGERDIRCLLKRIAALGSQPAFA